MSATKPRTLFDKIWDSHVVERLPDGTCILYIDRHLVHEVTSPQAFEGLRIAGRKVRRPDCTIAVADHNIPTVGSRVPRDIKEEDSRIQVETLEKNVDEFGVPYIPILDVRQGIVHIIGPELGLSPARHDDRLRRQPHLHARRDGRAGVRHRHLRGGARDGHPNAAAGAGKEHADRGGGHAGLRLLGQGHRAGDHRQDHHGRRHRARASNTPAMRSARWTWPGG